MGGSASLAQINHGMMNSEGPRSFGVVDRNQTSRLTLSSEVLAQLRRRSYSKTNLHSPLYRSRKKTERHQLPANVKALLAKIKVEFPTTDMESAGGDSQKDQGTRVQTSCTKQLVEHIFECLGALEHLVKIDQENAPAFDEARSDLASESQSVADANRESVGKLLHEMITIYSLCGDTVRVLLEATPEAAAVEDTYGRLALHVAVDRDKPWMDCIENLVVAFPQALNMRDSGGRLPLHIAVDREEPCLEVLRLLLAAYPQAAMARRGVGRLPLHYAVFPETPSLQIVECLLGANPESAQVADVYGRLGLHYAVEKNAISVPVVRCLLEVNPQGAAVRDSHARLPITIALERETINYNVIKILHEAYPAALQEPGPGNKLPLQYLVETECQNLLVVDYVARSYPDAIIQVEGRSTTQPQPQLLAENADAATNDEVTSNTASGEGNAGQQQQEQQQSQQQQQVTVSRRALHRHSFTSNPLQNAGSHRMAAISRCLLLIRPSMDPQRLRDLNWDARKIAFLLARHGERRPSLMQRFVQHLGMGSSSSSPNTSQKNSLCGSGGGVGVGGGSNKAVVNQKVIGSASRVPLSPSTSSPTLSSATTLQLFGTAVANALSSSPHNTLTPILDFSPIANNNNSSNNNNNNNINTSNSPLAADEPGVYETSSMAAAASTPPHQQQQQQLQQQERQQQQQYSPTHNTSNLQLSLHLSLAGISSAAAPTSASASAASNTVVNVASTGATSPVSATVASSTAVANITAGSGKFSSAGNFGSPMIPEHDIPGSTLTTSRDGVDDAAGVAGASGVGGGEAKHDGVEEYNIFSSERDRMQAMAEAAAIHPMLLGQTGHGIQPRRANRGLENTTTTATTAATAINAAGTADHVGGRTNSFGSLQQAPQQQAPQQQQQQQQQLQVNMYLKLWKVNPDLFRLAVLYL